MDARSRNPHVRELAVDIAVNTPRSTLRRAKPQLKLARCRTRASALTGHGCIPWPTGYFHPADSCGRKPDEQLSTGTDASPRRIRLSAVRPAPTAGSSREPTIPKP